MISPTDISIHTQAWTHADLHTHKTSDINKCIGPGTYQHRCICTKTQRHKQTPTPTIKENNNPATTMKASFTAQGVMGAGSPAGSGVEASASGGARPAQVPTQPQGQDAFILPTHHSLSPRAVTPSFLHCHLKSGPTLSQQHELQGGVPRVVVVGGRAEWSGSLGTIWGSAGAVVLWVGGFRFWKFGCLAWEVARGGPPASGNGPLGPGQF